MANDKSMTNYKYPVSYFRHFDFDIGLTFEISHLILIT